MKISSGIIKRIFSARAVQSTLAGILALGMGAGSSSAQSCTPPPSGLVSWWKGDGNFLDQVGTNNGTAIGTVTFPSAEVGHGFGFNNSRVDLGNPTNLQLQNFTIDAWIQLGDTNLLVPNGTGTYGEILSYGDHGYGFLILNSGQLGLTQVGDGGVVSTNKISDTAFHHVAVTRSGSNVVFYLDGVAEPAQTYNVTFQFSSHIAIGCVGSGNPAGNFFGTIDEVDIFNRALLGTEVQGIYNAKAAGKCLNSNCVTPPSGLVSWWKGDGNLLDQVGTNNGALIGNATYGSGEVGQAFVLDGVGDAVSVGNPANLQLQTFTIEAWIKRGSPSQATLTGGGDALIFGYGNGGYSMGILNAGQIYLAQVDGSPNAVVRSATALTDTNWHHVAVTKAGSTVVCYVDGVADVTNSSYNTAFQFTTPAAIGARGDSFASSFFGSIDEVSVYGRSLVTSEIQAIYNAGTGGKCSAIVPPTITAQPTNINATAGANVSFYVTATGNLLTYQWLYNSNILTSATNALLTLNNAQPADAGAYSVIVSNPSGSTNSINAYLAVNAAPCVTPASSLVSWWKGEGNTLDQKSTNNGTLVGNTTYGSGEAGQAFVFDGNGDAVSVGNSAGLQLQNFTIEAWVKRGNTLHTSVSGGAGVIFGYGHDGYALAILDDGHLLLTQIDDGGVNSTIQVTDTAWHHVALTKTNGTVIFYVDGVADTSAAPYTPNFLFSSSPAIGARGDSFGNSFMGSIDEVSVYNGVLTSPQIQAIYNAGSNGKCFTINPPLITVQPTNVTSVVGANISLSVTATGYTPTYQWLYNSNIISSATNAQLILNNVQASNAGVYFVVVSNSAGSVKSSNALVTINPVTCSPPVSNLVSWWKAEGDTQDQTGGNNGTFVGNTAFGTGEVGQSFVFDGSHDAVLIGNPTNLQSQNFTVEAWVKRSSVSQSSLDSGVSGVVFSYGHDGYGFGIQNNGQLFLTQIDENYVGSTFQVIDTAWHHLAVTKNGSTVVFYLDGVVDTSAPPYNTTFQFSTPAAIGARGDTYGNSFLGSIDEVSVYSRGLTSSEIQSIYNARSLGKCYTAVAPTITLQPQSVTNLYGATVSFSVKAVGGGLAYQWLYNSNVISGATSSTLSLTNVQATNAGSYYVTISNAVGFTNSVKVTLTLSAPICTPTVSNLVSWWSGNGNTIDQNSTNNGTLIGNATYGPGEVGQAFVLDGVGDAVSVGNPANLQLQTFTIEAWIKRGSPSQATLTGGGDALIFGYGSGGYSLGILNAGQIYMSQVDGPANANVRSATAITDSNWHHVAVAKSGTNVVFYVDGVADTSAPAFTTGFQFFTSAAIGARGDSFASSFFGSIDEVSVYNRGLVTSEIQAIYNAGPSGKCSAPLVIATQPANQVVTVGANATFSVTAYGQPTLSYQWKYGSTPVSFGTNATLTLTNVQLGQAGNYSVVVSNTSGASVVSSNATLTVNPPPALIEAISVTATSGIVTVPIKLVARGNENAFGFSFTFNPAQLTFVGVNAGSGAFGITPIVNTNLLPSGKVGVALSQNIGASFAAGTDEVVDVSFYVSPTQIQQLSPITFGDSPTPRQLSDAQAMPLAVNFSNGNVLIPVLGIEGDVSPRPNGDHVLGITDWVQVGRFVAGLDVITNVAEFQRADCAPRSTLGNGVLNVADWVQAGRYFAGLDPLVAAGGPGPNSGGGVPMSRAKPLVAPARTITAMNAAAVAGQTVQVSVQLNSQGNENGLEFSVNFDPTALIFVSATNGAGAGTASLLLNTTNVTAGKLGILMALPFGSSFASGNLEVVKLTFQVASGAGGNTNITFGANPLPQDVVDTAANDLDVSYVAGTMAITPIVRPMLNAVVVNGGLSLSWPASATGFNLESSTNIASTNWTIVNAALSTNGGSINLTNQTGAGQLFYRLHHP